MQSYEFFSVTEKDNELKDGLWPLQTSYIQYKYLCN